MRGDHNSIEAALLAALHLTIDMPCRAVVGTNELSGAPKPINAVCSKPWRMLDAAADTPCSRPESVGPSPAFNVAGWQVLTHVPHSFGPPGNGRREPIIMQLRICTGAAVDHPDDT